MRRYSLVVAMLVLGATACKKELTKTNLPGNTNTNNAADIGLPPPICANDHWDPSGPDNGSNPNIFLVYNNKVYFPQNANGNPSGDMTVHIYDGANWHDIASNIPGYTNYENFTFTIGNKGYVGFLFGAGHLFYEYDFANNTWTRKADFPGAVEQGIATFTIGSKGYVAGGRSDNNPAVQATWQYNPSNDNWVRKADLPTNRRDAAGFTIGNKGYIVNGDFEFGLLRSLVEFDPSANTWTFKSLFPGIGRYYIQVFVIDGIAYAGGGEDNQNRLTDFYKYDASSDTWTRILDIPLPNDASFFDPPHSFAINSTGYVGWANAQGEVKLKKYTPRICTQ